MRRSIALWILAVLVTLGSAVWQRMTGPTYPVRVKETVGGVEVKARFPRSATIDEAVVFEAAAAAPLEGSIEWRRWPTEDPWQTVTMVREGEVLRGEVPGLPHKAAKIEYRVRLRDGAGGRLMIPARLRFKGAVPTPVLIVHILAMFLGMLFSLRAGLEALARGPALGWQTAVTLVCLGAGGLMLGPVVQKYAFDAYWTGWPIGEDLTDNKLAVAVLFWAVAAWQQRRGRRWWSVTAAVVTFVIFVVPHSLHGSTHDWETGEHIQAAVRAWWPLA